MAFESQSGPVIKLMCRNFVDKFDKNYEEIAIIYLYKLSEALYGTIRGDRLDDMGTFLFGFSNDEQKMRKGLRGGVKSGPPPKKGPNPQGLKLKDVKKFLRKPSKKK